METLNSMLYLLSYNSEVTTHALGVLSSYLMFGYCEKLSTVTMLAPSTEITGKDNCVYKWLEFAGTKASSRILKVKDVDAYNALEKGGYLPVNWKIGAAGTTVKKEDNTEIK